MLHTLAHITPAEAPSGVLLFLAGSVVGAIAMSVVHRYYKALHKTR